MACGSRYNLPIAVCANGQQKRAAIVRLVQVTIHRDRMTIDNVSTMIERISPKRTSYFDMVAKFARSIVNRANQL
eukprot:4525150-Amphidinium_carterae.1